MYYKLELSHAATGLLQHTVRWTSCLCTSAAEVARQFAVDVGVRCDAVAVNVQLLVTHQSALLTEDHWRNVWQISE